MTICFDLDGVLAKYDGWCGWRCILSPVPGAKEILEELKKQGHTIIIYTTRGNCEVQEWCKTYSIPYDHINCNPDVQGNNPGKPIADVYVDDRAIKFNGDWQQFVRNLRAFDVWWEKGVYCIEE